MTHSRKKGKLRLHEGGLYATRTLSHEEWLERETRSLFASWKSNAGAGDYASRGIANVAQAINAPHRIPARRIREAVERQVRPELVRRFGELLSEYADRLQGRPTMGSRPDPDPISSAVKAA